ncbi:(2Fe-2S)-binding protein [Clostridium sp. MT-14]|uniref:(2Fe-2S)-binding protein n=1 Tax=Clostridium aromativorans TaxID=2836848 RepID=A0ABS8N5T2_9CLOT|nr:MULTISPECIES: (2Fe-2S)-binding protein [Clostridium]KAA8674955.1 (2Fe-2S)-binding protein [Clostridium sp. HV4-5-A1G]MCC9294425.1 (2Fe-2S)-binding protein [Clostridium aromativorans]CAB1255276.1 Xanthine dehydrogenase iron-sulfur subunit [Clostridiaceae bacterium BL-3]
MSKTIRMIINGKKEVFHIGHDDGYGIIPDEETLCETLRERLNLTGTKLACGQGACGCCTVLMNDVAVPSCQILTAACDGADVVTIEGLHDPKTGELDPLQQAFIDKYAFQCGYCTPGIIMALKGLFINNPHPSREEIGEALSGNMCRCISQYHVFNAAELYMKQNA